MKAKGTQNLGTMWKLQLALIRIAVIGGALLGCTKELPYDTTDYDKTAADKQLHPKTILPEPTESWLYVASSLNSSRFTNATFPQYMGESKIVRIHVLQDAIEIVEPDEDERFAENPVNSKPVMVIPVTHVDFRCATDADGKCTNKEEEDENKPWRQRQFFRVNPDRLAKQEVSQLPLEIKNLFYSCYEEVGSSFAGMTLEKESMVIQVEKSYRTNIKNPGCAGKTRSLSDLNFKVLYNYSFVKLSSVASPAYKPLYHNRNEESPFGFFDNNTLKLGVDNIGRVSGETKYLHRWNPKRNPVYRMTANFNKPEYKLIKQATVEAIASMNRSLEKAGADMRIDLQEATPNMNTGDIRVSSIVLVEDPVNYGILGYGPTAYNPATGEILQARAAMYLGVMKKGIERAYQEILEEKLSSVESAQSTAETRVNGSGDIITIGNNKGPMSLAPEFTAVSESKQKSHFNLQRFAEITAALKNGRTDSLDENSASPVFELAPTGSFENLAFGFASNANPSSRTNTSNTDWRKVGYRLNTLLQPARSALTEKNEAAIEKLVASTNCFFGEDDLNIHDLLEDEIKKLIEEIGAKPWGALTEAEQERIVSVLLPFVWTPTLIHEIGHTLGLRHNFAGSEDKKNFYTAEELKKLGMKRSFNYSSVMDYGYRHTNELRLLGKYDIAALRYGYAEKVELDDGRLVSLDDYRKNKPGALKDYAFCTDEHVDVNPNCNRFDEGTSLTEIAIHWMTMYEQNYFRRSFRNNLSDFSAYDEPVQLGRVNLVFDSLRSMFEKYESIKYTFGIDDSNEAWQKNEYLKDVKTSAMMAGQFFVNVLKTPDVLCAVARAIQPNQVIDLVPIRTLSPFAINCWSEEVQLNPEYVVVGQAGKSFQNRKSRVNNQNPYPYIDQIDVRGIWLDKMLALEALTGRLTGISTFDEYTSNYLDIPEAKEAVTEVMSQLLLDEVVAKFPVFTVSGQVFPVTYPVSLFDDALGKRSHKIPVPINPLMKTLFGIPNSGIDFQLKVVEVLKKTLPSSDQVSDPDSLLNGIWATTTLPIGQKEKGFLNTDVGIQKIFVNTRSSLSGKILAYKQITENLSSLKKEQLKKILEIIECKKQSGCHRSLPSNANQAEKFAYFVAGEEGIQRYLVGGFHSPEYYGRLLVRMSSN